MIKRNLYVYEETSYKVRTMKKKNYLFFHHIEHYSD